ncbi:methyltransferase domain-containing protein [Pseudoxanthomonas sp. F11]|uniref:methyltransferase domain-containing protein n=1 Tax=Pseudoxanthomonas sp. F11 TaxID=3126308 RepID=UPI00300D766C
MTRDNGQADRGSIDVDALVAGMRRELEEAPRVEAGPVDGRDLLARVRAELARRRSQGETAVRDESSSAPAVEWVPSHPRIPPKREYALAELTGFDDEDFVANAYVAILRRPPDPQGFAGVLHALREGKSKVELLGNIRWSAEGVSRGVHVDGLLLPYTLVRWEQKRYIGPVVAWLHGLAKLGVTGRRQRISEARQAREAHELGRLLNRLAAAEARARRDGAREMNQLAQQVRRGERMASRYEVIANQVTEDLHSAREESRQELQRFGEELSQIRRELGEAKTALATVRMDLDAACQRLAQVTEMEQQWREQQGIAEGARRFARALDPLYADFEDAFRGAREMIRSRAAPYLDWVREGGEITAEAPILDVGCGRGEWMELARDHGMHVRGIDINRVFIETCRAAGMDVSEGDAIEVMRAMPDASMGAVTSMHLVEHLPFESLILLIDEAFRVLRPGGVIVLETPNPENLSVSSHWFFLDPTHRNPLPPVTLAWLVRERGFVDPRIERLTEARDLNAPPLWPADQPGAETVNAVIERLHVAADYSIVARKPHA